MSFALGLFNLGTLLSLDYEDDHAVNSITKENPQVWETWANGLSKALQLALEVRGGAGCNHMLAPLRAKMPPPCLNGPIKCRVR